MFKDFVCIMHMKSRVATKLQRTRDTSINKTEKQKPSWSRARNLDLLEHQGKGRAKGGELKEN